MPNRTEHTKTSYGREWWNTYDESGNGIHYKNYNGYQLWLTYMGDGSLQYAKKENT